MKRQLIIFISLVITLLIFSACFKTGPTPEELLKIKELKTELKLTQGEISDTENVASKFSGGLLHALYQVRIEILKTNEAMIKQRIHALESGTEITLEIKKTIPSPEEALKIQQEINEQEKQLKTAKEEALNSAGLIGAMKYAVVATNEQTIAMLRQKYLITKYGLPFPQIKYNPLPETETLPKIQVKAVKEAQKEVTKDKLVKEILSVHLYSKEYTKQDYQDFLFFNIGLKAIGLDKPARAIKGILNFEDLFGESKLKLKWTLNKPIKPGEEIIEKGKGFKYNEFSSAHHWVLATDLKDMKASFIVKSIIYQDGTKRAL